MSKLKIPKSMKDIKNPGDFDILGQYNKTALDPLGIGLGDAVYGKGPAKDTSAFDAEQAKLAAQKQANYEEFIKAGGAKYVQGDDLKYEDLDPEKLAKLGHSGLDDISVDPAYHNAELDALRSLEEQSKDGLTARDRADMAKLQGDVGRTNHGRIGAIQQNMAARGLGGSGLEMVAQMQAAQDAADREATAALEQGALSGERRNAATNQRAALAGQMGEREYTQKANAANANDVIARFNATNVNNALVNGNNGRNGVAVQNFQRRNQTADNQTNANYGYTKDKLTIQNAKTGDAFNWSVDQQDRKDQAVAADRGAATGKAGTVLGVAGGVVGGIYGGPAGAAAGAQVGKGVGEGVGGEAYDNQNGYAHGGTIPGPEISPFDDPANDIFAAKLSPGEIVLPKSVAQDPAASAQFVAKENAKKEMDPMVLDHLAKSNPALVAEYRSKLQSAEQGQAKAKSMQDMGSYANIAGTLLTDYNNSQKKDLVHHNRMEDLGKPLQITKADRPQYDGSQIDKMGAQGVSRADAKLESIKKQMAQDYAMQRDDDKTAEDTRRYDQDYGLKQSSQEMSDKHFNAEMGQKDWAAKQAASQFGQSNDLANRKFGEEVRSHQADEALKGKEALSKTTANKPLSGEQQARYDSAAMGLKALRDMGSALKNGDNTFSMVGDNNYTKSSAIFEEALGRMQSGGAIGKEEVERFRAMAPKITDDAEMQQTKLRDLEAEMSARILSMGKDPEEAVRLRTAPGTSTQQTTTKPSWAK